MIRSLTPDAVASAGVEIPSRSRIAFRRLPVPMLTIRLVSCVPRCGNLPTSTGNSVGFPVGPHPSRPRPRPGGEGAGTLRLRGGLVDLVAEVAVARRDHLPRATEPTFRPLRVVAGCKRPEVR